MGKFLKWIGRLVSGLAGVLLLAVAGLLLAAWIADPAVPRNLLFGQSLSEPAAVQDSQPQEAVPGRPRDDIAIGAQVEVEPPT